MKKNDGGVPRARWHRVTWLVTSFWVVALVLAVAAQAVLPNPTWYLIHIAGLGVAGTSILIWTWHFADALTRTKQSQFRQLIRILTLSAGTIVLGVALATTGLPAIACGAAGGGIVSGVLIWHSVDLRRAMSGSFVSPGAVTLRYHHAASLVFVFGALVGIILTIDVSSYELVLAWWPGLYLHHDAMAIAHVFLMVLGFLGLTILGTLVTFGPTVARARMGTAALGRSRRILPLLVGGVVVGAAASAVGSVQAAGMAAAVWVVASIVGILVPMFRTWSGSMIGVTDGWFIGAAILWLEAAASVWSIQLLFASDIQAARSASGGVYAVMLAGGVLQLILGSLMYLLPVVAGGGPARLRASIAALEKSAGVRFFVLNGAVALALLPLGQGFRYAALGVAGLTAVTSFVLLLACVARQRSRPIEPSERAEGSGPRPLPRTNLRIGAVVAATVLAVTSGIGLVLNGHMGASEVSASDRPITRVSVSVDGMAFVPASIDVPKGNRLIIDFENTGDQRHDLVLANGRETGPVSTGEQTELDAGVIEDNTDAWCSLVGHRQMGMTLDIRVIGGGDTATGEQARHETMLPTMAELAAEPGEGFEPWKPELSQASDDSVHRLDLLVEETEKEVAPGRTQTVWTFNGQTPGPVLRGKIGDTFIITLKNEGSMGHSIDFHAGDRSPDDVMRTIEPGESLTYEFTANRSGIWMYHCSTSPMSLHIANGMFGAVIIDPPDLDRVDREYIMIQGEQYWGSDPEAGNDPDAVNRADPSVVTFNGYPFQYEHAPLSAQPDERIRIWVLNAGPNLPLSFHVVGTQFDTVWNEGSYVLKGGSGGAQVLPLLPAEGGFVEFVPTAAGHYTIVNHMMSYAERGARGTLEVE